MEEIAAVFRVDFCLVVLEQVVGFYVFVGVGFRGGGLVWAVSVGQVIVDPHRQSFHTLKLLSNKLLSLLKLLALILNPQQIPNLTSLNPPRVTIIHEGNGKKMAKISIESQFLQIAYHRDIKFINFRMVSVLCQIVVIWSRFLFGFLHF